MPIVYEKCLTFPITFYCFCIKQMVCFSKNYLFKFKHKCTVKINMIYFIIQLQWMSICNFICQFAQTLLHLFILPSLYKMYSLIIIALLFMPNPVTLNKTLNSTPFSLTFQLLYLTSLKYLQIPLFFSMSATENTKTPHHQNTRPSLPPARDKSQSTIRSLKSQLVSFKDSLTNKINEHSPDRVLQDISGSQTTRAQMKPINIIQQRVFTQENHFNDRNGSMSARSHRLSEMKPIESFGLVNNFVQTPSREYKSRNFGNSQELSDKGSVTNGLQFRNLEVKHQKLIPGQMVSPSQMSSRPGQQDLEIKLKKAQEKIREEHQEYLKKCLQVQKSKATITQMQQQKSMMLQDIEKLKQEMQGVKKNSSNISKILNDSRLKVIALEGEKKKLICTIDDERAKYNTLSRQKEILMAEIQNFKQVKQFMLKFEQTDEDHKKQIKNNIAYELHLIQVQQQTQKQLSLGSGDLKQAQQIHNSITTDITELEKQLNSKIKEIISVKANLEKELHNAREETETIRKNIFTSYQEQFDELQNQIITLKEENMVLRENSDSKISIIKLEREIGILKAQNKDLMARNKEMEEIVQKFKNNGSGVFGGSQNCLSMKKNISEISSESSSLKNIEYYDSNGHTDLELIIKNYESRSTDLNSRINEKQAKQLALKQRMEELQQQNQELKDELTLKSRKQRSITESSRNQVQAMRLQLKNEKQSLRCKIQMLQNGVKRKSKQIKQKDEFITNYLISKIKGEKEVTIILQQIKHYFEPQPQQS